ncbi:MAG: hypothetical protein ACR2PT_03990 [Endozoicomonas sp.]
MSRKACRRSLGFICLLTCLYAGPTLPGVLPSADPASAAVANKCWQLGTRLALVISKELLKSLLTAAIKSLYFQPVSLPDTPPPQGSVKPEADAESKPDNDDEETGQDDNNSDDSSESESEFFGFWEVGKFLEDNLQEEIKKLDRDVVLGLDIDRTAFIPAEELRQEDVKNHDDGLACFGAWLQSEWYDTDRPFIVLIYNTSRFGPLDPDWEYFKQTFLEHRIPLPHILIYNNGASVVVNPDMPEPLNRLLPGLTEFIRATQLLGTSYNNSEQRINTLMGEVEYSRLMSLLDQGSEAGICRSQTAGYILTAEYPGNMEPAAMFQLLASDEQTRQGSYNFHRDSEGVYVYNRTVNKGSALIAVINQLQPILKNPILFTAGDNLDDLPALRLDLVSQTFVEPGSRNSAEMFADFEPLELSQEQVSSVQKIWHRGILAAQPKEELAEALEVLQLDSPDKLLKAKRRGIGGLMDQVYEYLQSLNAPVQAAP